VAIRSGNWQPDQCLADGAPADQGGRHHHRGVQPHLRGTGITADLENGGSFEKARQMAAHSSTRTAQLYDRREDRVTSKRLGVLHELIPHAKTIAVLINSDLPGSSPRLFRDTHHHGFWP
jgi:hypothetical protein